MMYYVLGGVFLLFLVTILLWPKSTPRPSARSIAFAGATLSAAPVLNYTEAAMYNFLLNKVPPELLVFPQVRLADLIDLSATDRSAWQSAFNRIGNKSVDFAIVRASDCRCILVIEVDGPTHAHPERKKADATKDMALSLAGIRVLRIPASQVQAGLMGREAEPKSDESLADLAG